MAPSPKKERLVLVGNGMAGMRMMDEVIAQDSNRFEITVIGAEPHPNYNRIMLSSVLAGEKTLDEIVLHPPEFYARNNIELVIGDAAVSLDPLNRIVTTASGRAIAYDKLVLATGSRPLVPPIGGIELPGVCAFRNIADLELMLKASCQSDHRAAAPAGCAIVVGGGLLGLEAANGLLKRGMNVTVLHLMPTLMERQLDEAAGLTLQRDLERRGMKFITRAHTEAILGDDRARAVQLADGRELPADLVVFAIGVRPNIDLARKASLDVNRGIIVDDEMMTSDPAIFAVGECVEHRGQVFGLVGPLWNQARACAAALCGEPSADFEPPTIYTSLKVSGIHVFSAGALAARDDGDEEITLRDATGGIYKKLVLRDNKLVGAILLGDIADGPWMVELIESRQNLAALRDRLIFGRALALAA